MMTNVTQNVNLFLDLERHPNAPPGSQLPHSIRPADAFDVQARVGAVGQQLDQRFLNLLLIARFKLAIRSPEAFGAD